MTWYVVADVNSCADPDKAIWTLSEDSKIPGWETNSGFPGYGLTREKAKFLADVANMADIAAEIRKQFPWSSV